MTDHLALIRQDKGHAALAATDEFLGVLSAANLEGAERAMLTARAVAVLREALSDEVMKTWVMPLMNTPVGFDTDHNPAKGWKSVPYPLATVRECCIEAILHGLPLVGNSWNIIADRMYIRKEGFEGLLRGRCRFTHTVKLSAADARDAAKQQGGGYVTAAVTIRYRLGDGEEEAKPFSGQYMVRVNANNKVPVEASEGKALRKAYRDLWHALSGALAPEGEVGDVLELEPPEEKRAPAALTTADLLPLDPILPEIDQKRYETAIKKARNMDACAAELGPPPWRESDVERLERFARSGK